MCVQVAGITLMPVSYADNLGSHQEVYIHVYAVLHSHLYLLLTACPIAAVGGESLVGLSTPIILGGISCTGSEEHLLDCAHSGVGGHQCPVREAVASCAGQN